MSDKVAKQKQLLNNLLTQVQYLQKNGLSHLKLLSLPCQDYENILEKCVKVFSSEEMPSKKELITAKEVFEDTQNMMVYDFVNGLMNIEECTLNYEYFVLTSADIFRQKANEKIAKALENKKRGFCDQ